MFSESFGSSEDSNRNWKHNERSWVSRTENNNERNSSSTSTSSIARFRMIHKTCFCFVCVVSARVWARVSFCLCLYSFSSVSAITSLFLLISFLFFTFVLLLSLFSPFYVSSSNEMLARSWDMLFRYFSFGFWFVLLLHHFSLRLHFGSSTHSFTQHFRLIAGTCVCVYERAGLGLGVSVCTQTYFTTILFLCFVLNSLKQIK